MRGDMHMQVPSGAVYVEEDYILLGLMRDFGFVQYRDEPLRLKSGIFSNVYVFGREDLTDHPELEWCIGRKICKLVIANSHPPDDYPCLIGIPTAGTTLAQAAAMVGCYEQLYYKHNRPITHRLMREQPKDHGAHKGWINGKPTPGQTYWLVDNVATDGQSKLEAEEKLRADGYPTIHDNPDQAPCLIWVDRQQGAIARLKNAGFTRIVVGYNLLDLTFAFGELKLWPKAAVKAVENEIRQHQFLSTS